MLNTYPPDLKYLFCTRGLFTLCKVPICIFNVGIKEWLVFYAGVCFKVARWYGAVAVWASLEGHRELWVVQENDWCRR